MKSSAELNNMVKKILTLLKEYIIEHKVFLALFIVLGILVLGVVSSLASIKTIKEKKSLYK